MKLQLKNSASNGEIQLSDAAFGRAYNEALVHLLRGDLALGWEGYESRWERRTAPGRGPSTAGSPIP